MSVSVGLGVVGERVVGLDVVGLNVGGVGDPVAANPLLHVSLE